MIMMDIDLGNGKYRSYFLYIMELIRYIELVYHDFFYDANVSFQIGSSGFGIVGFLS